MFGDIGGLFEAIMIITAFILGGYTEHSYIIKALQKFYMAVTNDDDLFKRTNSIKRLKKLHKDKNKLKSFDKKDVKILKRNRLIKLSSFQVFKLLIMNYVKCFKLNRENRLWRLYEDGQERLEKEFDVVKIIRSIRNLKIFMNEELLSP